MVVEGLFVNRTGARDKRASMNSILSNNQTVVMDANKIRCDFPLA
jgi:hypothetical protein